MQNPIFLITKHHGKTTITNLIVHHLDPHEYVSIPISKRQQERKPDGYDTDLHTTLHVVF